MVQSTRWTGSFCRFPPRSTSFRKPSPFRHRRLKLGAYPHLSLADARERARRVLADAQAGDDPAVERQLKRSAGATFRALVEEVLEAKARETREKTRRTW